MPTLRFERRDYALTEGQSVLEALEQAGCEIPNSCRAGACQACLMQALQGEVPARAQQGVKDTLKAQGYFLACQCYPEHDLDIALPAECDTRTDVDVVEHDRLTPDVVRIRVRPAQPFSYRPGQYLTLWRDAHTGRSYSLASVPGLDADLLEFHVRRIEGGELSTWLYDRLKPGDRLQAQGPVGNCFYLTDKLEQPLLLIGAGTGLAPLWGVARDALQAGHRGEIHLYHGAVKRNGLYLHDQLLALTEQHRNFHYHPCVLEATEAAEFVSMGAVDELALARHSKLAGWKVYLCGAEEFVTRTRKRCFLAGAPMRDIYLDAFVIANRVG